MINRVNSNQFGRDQWLLVSRFFLIFLFVLIFRMDVLADTTTGLVGWWRFDEGVGTSAEDRSGHGNVGTLVNSPTWVTSGVRGGGLQFNGTNYVTVSSSSSLDLSAGEFTITMWLKIDPNSQAWSTLIAKGSGSNNWSIQRYSNTNDLILYDNNDGNNTTFVGLWAVIDDNQWHFLVWKESGSNATIYIDNLNKGTNAFHNPSQTSDNVYIGAGRSALVPITGILDDVRIYNRALTSQDLYMLYLSDNRIRNAVMRNVQFK